MIRYLFFAVLAWFFTSGSRQPEQEPEQQPEQQLSTFVSSDDFEKRIDQLQRQQDRYIKKQYRVEIGAAIIAGITLLVLGWQTWETRQTNLVARRAQLIDILYGEECSDSGAGQGLVVGAESEQTCKPKSALRARQEAALAFVDIERGRWVVPDLSNVNLPRARLAGRDLGSVNLTGANLSRAHLSWADLSRAELIWADLNGASLTRANLTGAHLAVANLTRADLTEAKLTGAYLTGADLSGAHLSGAHLTGAHLTGTDLTEADLSWAHLSLAWSLTQEQLDSACGDDWTTLPKGLTRPETWPCHDEMK